MEPDIAKLFEALDAIVDWAGSAWKEKRDAILAQASEGDRTNLDEFLSWFEEPRE